MKYAFLFVAFLFVHFAVAQTIFFNNIAQEQGLRNGNVRAVLKDYQGFVWIGTEDGLHRFEGTSMKIYSKVEGDSTSLGGNFILCLFQDSRHNLWVGTLDGGLNCYNRQKDSFKQYLLPGNNNLTETLTIRSLNEGKDKHLYVGTNNLFRSKIGHPDSMQFKHVFFTTDTMPKTLNRFNAITHDLDSNLLVSVNSKGLFTFDLRSGKSYPHPISELDRYISSIYVDRSRNLIWAGLWKSGLIVYDLLTGKHIQAKEGSDEKSLRNNFVPSVAGDARGNIWLATDNGLSMVSGDVDPFGKLVISTYLPGKSDNTRIHGSIFKTVYVDSDDKVWAGTIYEGVNLYDKNSMNFGSMNISTDVNSPLSYGNINALQEDHQGRLWLGLDGGGLYRFTGSFNNSKDYSLNHISVPENITKIKALKIEHDNLWIGTWGNGLLRYNTVTGSCKKIDTTPSGINIGTEVMSLATDASGNLWIGSFDKGLFRYRITDGQVLEVKQPDTNLNQIDRINAIYVDKTENVWLGKDVGGLNLLLKGDTSYRTITTNHLKPSTTVSSIYQDGSGVVWAGSPNMGLIRYDPRDNSSEVFSDKQGLTSLAIHAIEEDNLNRLWVSHNAGISMFDKKLKAFRNFGSSNGISTGQFNNNSSVRRSNGQMVFGHIHGTNSFTPGDFTENKVTPPMVFTRFFVDNVEQLPGTGILDESIITAQHVTLRHDQNSFSIEFAALSFTLSDHEQFVYMLEGFDTDWQPVMRRRLISYTNLEPGSYVLKVKARGGSNDDRSKVLRLPVTIVPAWWQTVWFRVLLGGALIVSALIFHTLRIRFLLRQKALLEAQVKARTQKLNEANQQLQSRIEEIHAMNVRLQHQQHEIFDKNNEILAQNEELQSQNEQIVQQQENLVNAREQLREINTNLEMTVAARTEELKHTINDLNKTVFELDRFVYSASHDLSAPLKSIHGLVELIKLEADHDRILVYTDYIKRTVLKLEDVIKSMIDYARNTHTLVKRENVNLKSLIEEVTSELAFWQEASKLTFINLVDENSQVHTDTARLKVILHNLVSNGIKYRDPNKDDCWIKFEYTPSDRSWNLSVTDNGIGIREQYLDKVFNMYFRATESSKGSGLGLFIVKETLRKINGTISVESELGNYTRFSLKVDET